MVAGASKNLFCGTTAVLCLALIAFGVQGAAAETLSWGSKGSGPGQFAYPSDVGVAPNGEVFVVDPGDSDPRVQRFTAAGAYLGEFGAEGLGPGEFERPFRLAMAPGGQVYVIDQPLVGNNGSVQRFSPTGSYEDGWGVSNAGSAAVAANGDVYVADRGARTINHYRSDGEFVSAWGGNGKEAGKFAEASDLEVDSAGRVVVLDNGQFDIVATPRVEIFSATGVLLDEWPVAAPGGTTNVNSLAIGPGGDLYITDGLGIDRFTIDGQFVGRFVLPSISNDMNSFNYGGLAATSQLVYIAYRGKQQVLRIDARTPDPDLKGVAEVLTGVTASFDAGGSKVPFGRIVDYQWDLDGDGTFELDTGTNPVATRAYASRGTVNVAVRVTGDLGGTAVKTVALKVLPASPPGPVGVSIENGAQYTNDPKVRVTLRWPPFASDLLISNDGGFFPYSQLQVDKTIKWKLRASGPERLPKTIYVRFQGGTSGPETYQDDIILDQTAPKLTSVTVDEGSGEEARQRARAGTRATLKVVASDRTSGVRKLQVTTKKSKPGKWKRYRPRLSVGAGKPLFVRVRDGAGNPSRWKLATPER